MFDLAWDGLEWLEQARVMKLQQQELAAAAEQGLGNAAKPQAEIPGPQMPQLTRENGAPTAGTPQ